MSRWFIFISVFLSIYGAMHLYLLIKVRRAYYLESWNYLLIVAVLLFLMLAPVQARVLESQRQHLASTIMTWISYLWMGCLFIWLWLTLVLDVYHLAVMMFQRIFYVDWIHLMLSRRQGLTLTMLITMGLMIYGIINAQHLRIEHLTLHSAKMPPSADRLRLVQISDVHLGQLIFPGLLGRITRAVSQAEPDILISTGDLIDGRITDRNAVIATLQSIKAPKGKFAVTGNHEAYAGLAYAEEMIKAAGFTLLRGTHAAATDFVSITGVDDPAAAPADALPEAVLMAQPPAGQYRILLKHQPQVAPQADHLIDLQLSGHTHQGQIFPFNLIVKQVYPLIGGMYPMPQGGHVYVSRGTGTWGPPVRIGAPPQITVIDLLPAGTDKSGAPADAKKPPDKLHGK